MERFPLIVATNIPLQNLVAYMSQGIRGASQPLAISSSDQPVSSRSSYALIVENEQLVGIITERDIVRLTAQETDFSSKVAADVMTTNLVTLSESEIEQPFRALELFRHHRIRHVPVVDDQGKVLGVITTDTIRHNLQSTDLLTLRRVEEVMTPQVIHALANTTALDLAKRMATHRVSCVVIIQDSFSDEGQAHNPIGIVTERDIVQFKALGLDLATLNTSTIMSTPLVCLKVQDDLWAAHQTMERMRVRRLVVTDDQDKLAGIITQTSILNALDPLEMQHTIKVLTQQIEQLENERLRLAQEKATQLKQQLQASESRFQAIFNQTFQFIGLLDPDGTLIEINQTALEFGGVSRNEVVNRPFWEARWWSISLEIQQALKDAIAQAQRGQFVRYVVEVLGADDQIITIDFSLRPVMDENGQVVLLIPEGRDITELKQAHLALLNSEERYAHLAAVVPVGIFHADLAGNCFYVNDLMCQLTGLTPADLEERSWIDVVQPIDYPWVSSLWEDAVHNQQPFSLSFQLQPRGGESLWVLVQAIPEPDANGAIHSYIGSITNIHRRKQAELQLRQLNQELFHEKELAQVTLQSIADAVITTNSNGEIQYFNPVAEQLTGWSASAAQGLPLKDVFNIINEITRYPVDNPVERVLREGCIAGLANHTVLISANGTEYSIEDSAAPIRDRAGKMIGAVIVFHDVTKARQLTRQMSWQALHDSLTELPNRLQFEQALRSLLDNTRLGMNTTPGNALCYLDLDQFKVVNDTCGHAAGDELLRQLSRVLKEQVRVNDLLARLGGDEFGVLLRSCSLKNAEAIAEKLRKAVHTFHFSWNNRTFSVGVSIGLVCFDHTADTLDELLRAADSACYAAKDQGRNRVHVYQVDDADLLKQRGERQWSMVIKRALADNRFRLYHQPIVEMTETTHDQPLFYEVLLRMLDKQGRLILPGSFIPAAERYDLMPDIDRWVIQAFFSTFSSSLSSPQVVPQASPQDTSNDRVYFINLSGVSVGDAQFLEFVIEQLKRHHIAPQTIGFEITETAAIANLAQATRFINELHDLGCLFALDDFGSGMSSFGYLKNLAVDYLKIDGNFVTDIKTDPTTYAIVESINHIGHVMGIKTIAESVEDRELRELLTQMDIDYAQGYGIAPPRPMGPTIG